MIYYFELYFLNVNRYVPEFVHTYIFPVKRCIRLLILLSSHISRTYYIFIPIYIYRYTRGVLLFIYFCCLRRQTLYIIFYEY